MKRAADLCRQKIASVAALMAAPRLGDPDSDNPPWYNVDHELWPVIGSDIRVQLRLLLPDDGVDRYGTLEGPILSASLIGPIQVISGFKQAKLETEDGHRLQAPIQCGAAMFSSKNDPYVPGRLSLKGPTGCWHKVVLTKPDEVDELCDGVLD